MTGTEGLCIEESDGRRILDDVDWTLGVGETGSGKTTLALVLLGAVRPGVRATAGRVTAAGREVLSMSASSLRPLRR